MELVISGPRVETDKVTDWMAKYGLVGHVTPMVSVRRGGDTEPGAIIRIVGPNVKPSEVVGPWEDLRTLLGIQCGHVTVFGVYQGCTEGYIRGACPYDE